MNPSNAVRAQIKRMIPASLTRFVQKRRLRSHLAAFPGRTVRHRYAGCELQVRIEDSLAEGWYDHSWPMPPEVAALKASRLRPGTRVFDLGAHQGVFAMILASETGPNGKVVAVEGSRHNAEVARRNFQLNQLDQIEMIHAVVAEQAGAEIPFRDQLNGQVAAQPGRNETVVSVSVDELAARHGCPDVVVIDVEGYECSVLRGANETLRRPVDWLVEVHHDCGLEHFGSVEMVLDFFPAGRFALQVAAGEGCEFRPYEREQPVPAGKFFLLASPPE